MTNIYDIRRYGTIVFFAVAVALVLMFIYVSDNIVQQLARQERDRMEIWADATKAIVNSPSATDSAGASTDIDFMLSIIDANATSRCC